MSQKRTEPINRLRALLADYPPFYVIALGKEKKSMREIAEKSGISQRHLYRLSDEIEYTDVPMGKVFSLWDACGLANRTRSSISRTVNRLVSQDRPMPHLSDGEWKRFNERAERFLKLKQPA